MNRQSSLRAQKRPLHNEDAVIYTDMSGFPMNEIPSYIKEGIGGICLCGTAVLNIFSFKMKVARNNIIVILPNQLVSVTEASSDFSMRYFKISELMFQETLSVLWRMTPDFFFYMRNHAVYHVTDEEAESFQRYCNFLITRANRPVPTEDFRRENILQVLRIFYWELYVSYKENPEAQKTKYSHKEKLVYDFFCLVLEHYQKNSEVTFYADKLNVSPKYLAMVVYSLTGRSAKSWIVEYMILEIKALLRNCSLDIKEVVSRTKFPNQSLLSRFFRKYAGMSPTEYRNSIYI